MEATGINRYMLGCKFGLKEPAKLSDIELIDTCWDVNWTDANGYVHRDAELIDTCWNVNMFSAESYVRMLWN